MFKNLLLISLISVLLSSCSSTNDDKKPTNDVRLNWSLEGELRLPDGYERPKMDDETSFLHKNNLSKNGFQIVWSSRLQNNKTLRKFYVVDDTVFLETTSNELHAYNRKSGEPKWIVLLNNPLDFPPTLMQSPSDGERIFYCIAKNYLYAIDATVSRVGREYGKIRWKYHLDYTPTTAAHATENFVTIGAEEKNFVMALHVKSTDEHGTKILTPRRLSWKRQLGGRITSTPTSNDTLNNNAVIFATNHGKIRALDIRNGDRGHYFPKYRNAGAFKANLVRHGNDLFAACQDHTLYILDSDSLFESGKITLDSPLSTAPWVLGNFSFKGPDNVVNDLDIFIQSDGTYQSDDGYFHHIVISDIVVRKSNIIKAPVFEEGEEGDENAEIKAVKVTEELIYRYELEDDWKLRGQYSYLFRTHKSVYLQQDNNILHVNKSTGQILNEFELGNTPLRLQADLSPEISDNRLFIATDKDIYVIEVKN